MKKDSQNKALFKDKDTRQLRAEERWAMLKHAVMASAEENIGRVQLKLPKNPWMSDAMLKKM